MMLKVSAEDQAHFLGSGGYLNAYFQASVLFEFKILSHDAARNARID